MVIYIIRDVNTLIEAIKHSRYVLYREYKIDSKTMLRIRAGTIGFEKEYDLNDPKDKKEYDFIIEALKMFGATKVEKVVREEEFF